MDLDLTTISKTDVDQATEQLIAELRAKNPTLDLRAGTALRELLVGPAAQVYAAQRHIYGYLQSIRSLGGMIAADIEPTDAQLEAVLSPLTLDRKAGSRATGMLRVVTNLSRTYVIGPTSTFTDTVSGTVFATSQQYLISPTEGEGDIRLYPGVDGTFYFYLPVVAQTETADGQVTAGTQFTFTDGAWLLVTAAVDFSGGADPETPQELAERIPAAVAHRAVASQQSTAGMIMDAFPQVRAVRTQGYGDLGQRRNRRNPLGIAATGQIDVYIRDFSSPSLEVVQLTGTRTGDGEYLIQVPTTVALGFMKVLSVQDVVAYIPQGPTEYDPENPCAVLDDHDGTYRFRTIRSVQSDRPDGAPSIPGSQVDLGSNSIYQTAKIYVEQAPDLGDTWEFLVTFMVSPALGVVTNYLTTADNRPLAADIMVRAPHAGFVSLYVPVVVKSPVDGLVEQIQIHLANYINSRYFTEHLTEAEILREIHQMPIHRVKTGHGGFRMSAEFELPGGGTISPPVGTISFTHPRMKAAGIIPETSALVAIRKNIEVEIFDD